MYKFINGQITNDEENQQFCILKFYFSNGSE